MRLDWMFNDKFLNNAGLVVAAAQLLMVGLKLHNDIQWSWWIVLLPTLITLVLLVIAMGILVLIMKGVDR